MAVNIFIEKHKDGFEKAMTTFKTELKNMRTGRASAGLVEDLMVEAYGQKQPLKQLANFSIPENNAISIAPWDKSIIKDVEKALVESKLGLNVMNMGTQILAKVPLMTEENRKEMVKILGARAEENRIKIRQVRDTVKDEITKAEKNKEITEDDKFKYIDDLDNYVAEKNQEIDQLREDKEKEIMKV